MTTTTANLTATIHHLAFAHHADDRCPGERTYQLANEGTTDEDICELLFHHTNCPDEFLGNTERLAPVSTSGRCYSTSVGDVIEIRQGDEVRNWICCSWGWNRLDREGYLRLRHRYCLQSEDVQRNFWSDVAHDVQDGKRTRFLDDDDRQVVVLRKLKVNYKVESIAHAGPGNRNGRDPMNVEVGEIVTPGVVSIMSQPGFADVIEIVIK